MSKCRLACVIIYNKTYQSIAYNVFHSSEEQSYLDLFFMIALDLETKGIVIWIIRMDMDHGVRFR